MIPIRRHCLMHLWFLLIVIYDLLCMCGHDAVCGKSRTSKYIEAISFQPTEYVLHTAWDFTLLLFWILVHRFFFFCLCLCSVIIMSNFICICKERANALETTSDNFCSIQFVSLLSYGEWRDDKWLCAPLDSFAINKNEQKKKEERKREK